MEGKERGRKTEGFQGTLAGLCLAADDSITFARAWREEKATLADWKRNVVKGVVIQAVSRRFTLFIADLMKVLGT